MAMLYTAEEVNRGICEGFQKTLATLREHKITPTLATVRVGEDGTNLSYERGATKRIAALGLGVRNITLPEDATQTQVHAAVIDLGADDSVHGILLLQPLPAHLDAVSIRTAIRESKDVDCATPGSQGAVLAGSPDCWPSCAPAAVLALLAHYGIPLKGKQVTVVGAGLVVGRPLAMLLAAQLATVTLCNEFTQNLPALTRQADFVVAAAGVPGLITAEHVRTGQIVIDVGTTYRDGKLYGDVDAASIEPIVAAFTPTPGGVTGITTTVLAKHVIAAAERQTQGL